MLVPLFLVLLLLHKGVFFLSLFISLFLFLLPTFVFLSFILLNYQSTYLHMQNLALKFWYKKKKHNESRVSTITDI